MAVESIDAIVARLLSLHPKLIDLSLERMWRMLDALGHPECRVPPVIHVAGTNGKGSTIAFLRAMLEAAGQRVHVYTSPHLVRYNERFRLGGTLVGDDELAATLAECERINAGAPITVFEITTAVGFMLFARHPADVLLLETGMGGRLDATNVVSQPLVSIITPVSLDHADFLGDSVSLIAGEKAGILKARVPGIVAPQPDDALHAIERRAAEIRAPLRVSGEHWSVQEERGRLVYQDDDGLLDLPAPKLYGRHQFINAGTAVAALRTIMRLPPAAYEAGILDADWPARLQLLSHGDLAALTPPGSELWLDGGHNAEGGRALAAALADFEERVPRPLILIVGMLATKDVTQFLRNFPGLARRVIAVPIPHQDKTLPAEAIAEAAHGIGIPAESCDSVEGALACVRTAGFDPPPRILIAGSLYLAGEVLALNGTLPD